MFLLIQIDVVVLNSFLRKGSNFFFLSVVYPIIVPIVWQIDLILFFFEKYKIIDKRCKKIRSQKWVWFFIAVRMLGSLRLIIVEELDLE